MYSSAGTSSPLSIGSEITAFLGVPLTHEFELLHLLRSLINFILGHMMDKQLSA